MRTIDLKFIKANKHVFNHKKCVFVVGAGISVESGIPDFRSPTGIFANLTQQLKMHGRNLFVYSFGVKEGSRKVYLKYISSLKKLCDGASPNETHRFLASCPRSRTYTQNIDGLEEKAGMVFSKHSSTSGVYLHGNLSCLTCQYCGFKREFTSEDVKKFESAEEIECGQCRERQDHCLRNGMRKRPVGRMHPGIIHYQQAHPDSAFISKMCERDMDCDLLIVIGTSLVVDGVKKLVKMFSRCPNVYGRRILVNLTPPNKEWSDVFDFFFHGDCKEFVREVSSLSKTKTADQTDLLQPRISSGSTSSALNDCGDNVKIPSSETSINSELPPEHNNAHVIIKGARGISETHESDSEPENATKGLDGSSVSHTESGLRRALLLEADDHDYLNIEQSSLEQKLQDLSRTLSDEECISKPVLDEVLKNARCTDIQSSAFIDLEDEIANIVSKSVIEDGSRAQHAYFESKEKKQKGKK